MTIQTVDYYYEPTPDDIAKFEAIWLRVWEPHCSFLDNAHYNFFRNFAFDNYLLGINQHRRDIIEDLNRTMSQ